MSSPNRLLYYHIQIERCSKISAKYYLLGAFLPESLNLQFKDTSKDTAPSKKLGLFETEIIEILKVTPSLLLMILLSFRKSQLQITVYLAEKLTANRPPENVRRHCGRRTRSQEEFWLPTSLETQILGYLRLSSPCLARSVMLMSSATLKQRCLKRMGTLNFLRQMLLHL